MGLRGMMALRREEGLRGGNEAEGRMMTEGLRGDNEARGGRWA